MDGYFLEPSGEGPASLAGSRCRSCRRVFFPVKNFCPQCLMTDSVEVVPLSRHGILYSFSVAYTGPVGFNPPYALGYVDLPEGVRVFSIIDWEPNGEQLSIGQHMELLRVGDQYRFRPSCSRGSHA